MFFLYVPERTKSEKFCEVSQGVPKVNISVKWVTEHSTEDLKSVSKSMEMTALGQ